MSMSNSMDEAVRAMKAAGTEIRRLRAQMVEAAIRLEEGVDPQAVAKTLLAAADQPAEGY